MCYGDSNLHISSKENRNIVVFNLHITKTQCNVVSEYLEKEKSVQFPDQEDFKFKVHMNE